MSDSTLGFYYSAGNSLQKAANNENIIANTTEPFVIHQDISTIIVDKWPGELWFVNAKAEALEVNKSNTLLASQLKLLKKLPNSLLFGRQGEKICTLLDTIPKLSPDHIEALATLSTPMAAEVYSNAWNNWLIDLDNKEYQEHLDADHRGTLAIGSGEFCSPIYSGFLLINQLLHNHARQQEDETALVDQNIYENKTTAPLDPTWNQACSVLLQTAMGLGAPHYVSPQDLDHLLAGWPIINAVKTL